MSSSTRFPASLLAAMAITLPWLNPFASGPSPPVDQWLVTLVCASVLLGLAAFRQLDHASLARACVQGWLLAALVSSVLGVVQYFGASEALTPWVNRNGPGEAFANLRQRNQFATLTNMGLAALLWGAAQMPREEERGYGGMQQVSLLLMAALLALGNATSSSRTGMVQLLLLVLLVAAWHHFGKRADGEEGAPRLTVRLMLVALAVYGLSLSALPRLAGLSAASHGALARLVEGDNLCNSRITLWRNVLHLIAQKPWLGWGWGELSYAHYITVFPGTRFCEILDNAHNLPLHLAVELGVPAAALMCIGAIALAVRAQPWRERNPAKRVAWAVLAVILLHSMLEYPLWYGPFLTAAILCLVLLGQSQPNTDLATPTKSWQLYGSLTAASSAVAVLALTAYTAWDYDRVSQIFLAPSARAPAYQDDTLTKRQGSWLFRKQVRYAELTTTPVTASNAAEMHAMALELLHFSPEARVIEKLIESDVQLGLNDEAQVYMQRFRAAFPTEYARWLKGGRNG